MREVWQYLNDWSCVYTGSYKPAEFSRTLKMYYDSIGNVDIEPNELIKGFKDYVLKNGVRMALFTPDNPHEFYKICNNNMKKFEEEHPDYFEN